MIQRTAYKFQLINTISQEKRFRQNAGCCRFVWNKALALQKERLEGGEKIFSFSDLCKQLTSWKREEPTHFLTEAQSQTLQQTLKFLDRSLREAFDKTNPKRFPRFKKKGQATDSFRYPQGFKLDQANSRIYLPKLGWLRYRNSRSIEGTPKNVTVSRRSGRWYVSIQTEREIETPIHPATSAVGIDVGIANFATLSGAGVKPLDSSMGI